MTPQILHEITPDSAHWKYLGVTVMRLTESDRYVIRDNERETALVIVAGSARLTGPDFVHELTRRSPFTEMADTVYVPPRTEITIEATAATELAMGTAPASGEFPLAVIEPETMPSVLRGGGPAYRQVTSPLADPQPAERLVVYEAYLPRGAWSGWPPHRHDGKDNSPYLEETYYFRFDRESGYGMHRNFDHEGFDESFVVRDGSLVTVPRGYHVCTAAPASNAWILNFLAGSSKDRPKPPVFDEKETWISDDWSAGAMTLPAVTPHRTQIDFGAL